MRQEPGDKERTTQLELTGRLGVLEPQGPGLSFRSQGLRLSSRTVIGLQCWGTRDRCRAQVTCPQDGTDVGASWTGAVVMLGQMEWMHVVTEVPAGGPRGVGMTGPWGDDVLGVGVGRREFGRCGVSGTQWGW